MFCKCVYFLPQNKLVRNLSDNWSFGETLCKLVPLVQALSVYVSVLAMTVTAIDRYQALVKPLEPRLSHRLHKSALIGLIWVSALLLAAPNAIFNIVVEIKMYNSLQVQEDALENNKGILKSFNKTFNFLLFSFLPCTFFHTHKILLCVYFFLVIFNHKIIIKTTRHFVSRKREYSTSSRGPLPL